MKEVEAIIGIVFTVGGSILLAMNLGIIIKLLGLFILMFGVMIYIVVVDSIEIKRE